MRTTYSLVAAISVVALCIGYVDGRAESDPAKNAGNRPE
jgi:hypothetical protein